MNPRLYFDEKTLKKLGDVFVVNTHFPIKTIPDSADYFLLVYIAHSKALADACTATNPRVPTKEEVVQILEHLYE